MFAGDHVIAGTNLGVHTEVRVVRKGPWGHPGSTDPLQSRGGPLAMGGGTWEARSVEKQTERQPGSSAR